MKKITMKKMFAAVLAFGLACSCLAGCGSNAAQSSEVSSEQGEAEGQETSDGESFKIAVGLSDSGATMFSLMSNNVKTMVGNMGGTVVFQGGVGASADATIQFVEDQIAAGANGIILSPPSDSVLKPLRRCVKKLASTGG